jgi:hypothetical protein
VAGVGAWTGRIVAAPRAKALGSLLVDSMDFFFLGQTRICAPIDSDQINIESDASVGDHDAMETNDKETRTTEQLYALRKQVVRLHLKGLPVMQIVAMTGLS